MEINIKEILNLAFKISIESCEGCINNYGSQKDHTCLQAYFYNLALEHAIKEVKDKYKIEDNLDFIYEKYHTKEC